MHFSQFHYVTSDELNLLNRSEALSRSVTQNVEHVRVCRGDRHGSEEDVST